MTKEKRLFKPEEIIPVEDKALKMRRQKLFSEEHAKDLNKNRFGIALSGGGIRSATINLGFLKTLNRFGILKKADYLSTVSGGGYCGSYIETTLKESNSYKQLFADEHIKFMRNRGAYLVPGKGVYKLWNQLVLIIGYLASWLMSLASPVILILLIWGTIKFFDFLEFDNNAFSGALSEYLQIAGVVLAALVLVNYILNIFYKYELDWSSRFHKAQTVFVGFFAAGLTGLTLYHYHWESSNLDWKELWLYLFAGLGLIVAGFFTSPNASSFHRFYRNKLAEAFLNFSGKNRNLLLHKLFDEKSEKKADYLAPYPIVNTCLNLQATDDPKFKGTKTSDYFLLSPKFCGSKLTDYVRTDKPEGFNRMTYPAAITISAAAVNPGMGIYSNKILAVLTTLLNARLGYWAWNPLKSNGRVPIVWWPFYFIYELLSQIGTENNMINISDGGHIENLAVYELLRRKCRLIIGVDAGEDGEYAFFDIENLAVRARNELGVEIRFRKGQSPEEVIRPKPSAGYSRQRYAIADLYTVWEEFMLGEENDPSVTGYSEVEVLVNYFYEGGQIKYLIDLKGTKEVTENGKTKRIKEFFENDRLAKAAEEIILKKLNTGKEDLRGWEKLKFGTFVYVKSSMSKPKGKPPIDRKNEKLKFGTYKYRIHHPSFPHEPTSDQFFDEIQWESYFQLGQFIGAEVLDVPDFGAYHSDQKEGRDKSLDRLIGFFDGETTLFDRDEIPVDAMPEAKTRGLSGKDASRYRKAKNLGYEM